MGTKKILLPNLAVQMNDEVKIILEVTLRSYVIATFSDYNMSRWDELDNQDAHRSSIQFEKC